MEEDKDEDEKEVEYIPGVKPHPTKIYLKDFGTLVTIKHEYLAIQQRNRDYVGERARQTHSKQLA